jgi:micrococcal nuclease
MQPSPQDLAAAAGPTARGPRGRRHCWRGSRGLIREAVEAASITIVNRSRDHILAMAHQPMVDSTHLRRVPGEGKVRLLPLLGLLLVIATPALAQKCARGSLVAEVTHVRDGDTIEVGGLPIRLQGLAAPEGDEPGGDEATEAMVEMVLGRELRCELDSERTYDRCVGIYYLEGRDISGIMVRRGLARDCARFSRVRWGTPVDYLDKPSATPQGGQFLCR